MFTIEDKKALIAEVCAEDAKKVTPGGMKPVDGGTALFSDSWEPYVESTTNGLDFTRIAGQEAEELGFVGATQGVSSDQNSLVVGMLALANGEVTYRGKVRLASDTQISQTVTYLLENNTISRIVSSGAEMTDKVIRLKEYSKEDILKFSSSDGYTLKTRLLDVVDEESILMLLEEAFSGMKPGSTFGFVELTPEPSDDEKTPAEKPSDAETPDEEIENALWGKRTNT